MSDEEDVDVYGECRNFIKFCKEQGIQVTSEAVATVWAGFLTSVAIEEDEEDTTLDDYSIEEENNEIDAENKEIDEYNRKVDK
jgi:hypothetical protein|tara:strand:+ start:48 stop:296 length:249 start_codon:yes stop_codon:yes gene_type:complete